MAQPHRQPHGGRPRRVQPGVRQLLRAPRGPHQDLRRLPLQAALQLRLPRPRHRGHQLLHTRTADSARAHPGRRLLQEVGYQFTPHLSVSANAFYIYIQNPIVYYSAGNGATQSYVNFPKTGTEGVEAEFRLKYKWGYDAILVLHRLVDFHRLADEGSARSTRSPTTPRSWRASRRTRCRSTATSPSGRGCPSTRRATSWALRPVVGRRKRRRRRRPGSRLPAQPLRDLQRPRRQRPRFRAGVFDLLNERYTYLQPYQSGHAPLPGPAGDWRGSRTRCRSETGLPMSPPSRADCARHARLRLRRTPSSLPTTPPQRRPAFTATTLYPGNPTRSEASADQGGNVWIATQPAWQLHPQGASCSSSYVDH